MSGCDNRREIRYVQPIRFGLNGTGGRVARLVPEWLSGTLRIEEGTLVSVDNENGKFNIRPVNPQPVQ